MGVKTITARETTARKSNVMDFFGVLKDSKNLEEMEKEILEQRKKICSEFLKFSPSVLPSAVSATSPHYKRICKLPEAILPRKQ